VAAVVVAALALLPGLAGMVVLMAAVAVLDTDIMLEVTEHRELLE
jgi:hypothetical protein